MNDVIARMWDFKDYLFNKNVIKEEKGEDRQFKDLQIENENLKHENDIVKMSRDRYLETCKKRSAEKKECKQELKKENEKRKMLEEENQKLKEKIKELENEKKI